MIGRGECCYVLNCVVFIYISGLWNSRLLCVGWFCEIRVRLSLLCCILGIRVVDCL